jgi:hypothetical protein
MRFLHLSFYPMLTMLGARSEESLRTLLQTGPVSPAGPDFPKRF